MGKLKTILKALKGLFSCCYKTVDIVDNLTSDHHASKKSESKIIVIDEKNNNHEEIAFDHPISVSIHGNVNIINSSLDNLGMHHMAHPQLVGEASDSYDADSCSS